MTDEMKLLRALCEVLGFKVKVNLDYKRRKEPESSAMRYNNGRPDHERVLIAEGFTSKLLIDEEGNYTSKLKVPEISYSLTRIGEE